MKYSPSICPFVYLTVCRFVCFSSKKIQLSKMLCKDAPLTDKQLEHNVLSPDFADVLSSLKLWKAPFLFGEYFLSFYDFKILEWMISLFNSNAASREIDFYLMIFITFMVSQTANWRAHPWHCVKCTCGTNSFMRVAFPVLAPNHVGYFIITLNFTIC